MTGEQALANAIIDQAAKDYRGAIQDLRRNPRNQTAKARAQEVESFFYSNWYAMLTDLNPEYLIERLRREIA